MKRFSQRYLQIREDIARACLKNHFRNLQAPLCGIFCPHSVAVARYAALIRIKSPTNWDSQFTKSLFQTRSSEWKDIWNNLMKEAQRVYIEAKDNMVMYQYYYDLAVEVPCV